MASEFVAYEDLWDRLAPTITRISDADLVAACREAVAKRINAFIIVALLAEATYRGIEID